MHYLAFNPNVDSLIGFFSNRLFSKIFLLSLDPEFRNAEIDDQYQRYAHLIPELRTLQATIQAAL